MGPCNSSKAKRDMKTSPTVDQRDMTYTLTRLEKTFNPHSVISGLSGQVVIKHINDVNGDMVKIDNCKDSTVIIMDTSAQVIVFNCVNCNIFIAPCKGAVLIRESQNLRVISASNQFRCSDVINCKAAVYANTEPALERVKDFSLGCFFFMYTELPDLFLKAELSVWDNSWSEFHDYTPALAGNLLGSITYFNAREDAEFTAPFSAALRDQEISVDQYFPVPLTMALATGFRTNSAAHLLFLFKEQNVDTSKLYELLSEETLASMSTVLIRARFIETKGSELIKQIKNNLPVNQKSAKEFFEADNLQLSNKFSSSVIRPSSTVFTSTDGFVMLWLANDRDNFTDFLEMAKYEFENCLCLREEDFTNVSKNALIENKKGLLQTLILNVFPNYASVI